MDRQGQRKKKENKGLSLAVKGTVGALLLAALVLLVTAKARQQELSAPRQSSLPETATPMETQGVEAQATPEAGIVMHRPYLFADADGFLCPDEPLGEEGLRRALEILLPGDLTGAEQLRETLSRDAAALSRRDFARRVAAMSGWSADEQISLAPDAGAPTDLDRADPDFALLMEATVAHSEDTQGVVWTKAVCPGKHAPGVFLRGADLYCCGEDGYLLRNTCVTPLCFGADGRYSSGDEELDGYTREILAQLQEQFPEDAADRLALLKHANDYVRENFSYLGRRHVVEEGKDWNIEEAKVLLSTGKGNCYYFASGFRALARQLGFPANTAFGSLAGDGNIHAWTDLVIQGVPFTIDPQLEQRYKNDRFMRRYEDAAKNGYSRPDVEEMLSAGPYRELNFRQDVEQRGEVIAWTGENGAQGRVYLPCDYDGSKQYPVLLCLGADPAQLLGEDEESAYDNPVFHRKVTSKAFLDFLIQSGECAPLIVAAVEDAGQAEALLLHVTENYASFAEEASIEAIRAARGHFALACTGKALPETLPDLFGCVGLIGDFETSNAELALSKMSTLRFLLVAEGENSEHRRAAEETYLSCAGREGVWHSSLLLVPKTGDARTVLDAGLRHLLLYFAPNA